VLARVNDVPRNKQVIMGQYFVENVFPEWSCFEERGRIFYCFAQCSNGKPIKLCNQCFLSAFDVSDDSIRDSRIKYYTDNVGIDLRFLSENSDIAWLIFSAFSHN